MRKIKYLALTLGLLFSGLQSVNAQLDDHPKALALHDMSISTGIITFNDLFYATGIFGGPISNCFSPLNAWPKTTFFTLGFLEAKKNKMYITIGYERIAGDLLYDASGEDLFYNEKASWASDKIGTFSINMLTAAIEYRRFYVNSKYFKLYSSTGYGISYVGLNAKFNNGIQNSSYYYGTDLSLAPSQDYTEIILYRTWHVTPIGIAVGNGLSGFAELGLGYRGLISFGISYKLDPDYDDRHPRPQFR